MIGLFFGIMWGLKKGLRALEVYEKNKS